MITKKLSAIDLNHTHTILFALLSVTIGKNKPLSAEKPKWKSEVAMTRAQLKSKQDEFWETSPAYEGRKEIWDALKAACETDDVSLAQAIIDGANITLPTGSPLLLYFILSYQLGPVKHILVRFLCQ